MKKEIKIKQSGITLVALVITIIVMLILAGVSVSMLFGENGILKNTEKAAEETLIKGYEEKIILATTEGKSNALIEPEKYEDKEDILDDIENIIKKDTQFEESKIYKIGSGTEEVKLVVVTKEGYVYYVEVDKTEYAGTKEEVGDIILDTEIQTGEIAYTCEPNIWTNKEVEVKIEIAKEEYKDYDIEYSYDAKTWNKYEKEQTITVTNNNTIIYTRLRSDNVVLKGYATGNITNIDRLEPNEFIPTAESTTNSITVTTSAEDSDATATSGKSGVAGYRFKLDSGTWTEYQTSGTYTWNNLTQTTNYTITVEVKDNAGNTKTATVTKGTGTIETASGASYTPTTWTNGKVTVTLPTKSGYTTRYTTDGTVPTKTSTAYSSAFTVSSNCTINYIYTDGTNIGGAGTANITNIDTTSPVVTSVTSTTNKITITATDEASGIIGYAVTTSTTTPTSFTSCTNTKSLSKTVTGKTQGTTYYVWVKDQAGNISSYKSTTTGTVTGLVKNSNVTFTPSTTAWTNSNVTVTAKTTVTGYTLQTSTNGSTWTTTNSVTFSSNGTMYARLWDGTNAGTYASYTVTNIDTTKPTIGSVTGSTSTGNTGTVKVSSISDSGGSGLSGIYISTSSSTPTSTASGWISSTSSSYTKTVSSNGTYYVWVKDAAGNVSSVKSCTVSGIVAKVTGVSLSNATVYVGNTVTISKTLSGSSYYKSIAFTSGSTSVATITSGTGVATGKVAGTSTITCTVTNYDGTTVKGTCTLTVKAQTYTISYRSNGGSGSMSTTTGTVGQSVSLRYNSFTAPSGKVFICWSTNSGGTGSIYKNGASYSQSSTSSVTLYAIWGTELETARPSTYNYGYSVGHTSVGTWSDVINSPSYKGWTAVRNYEKT